MKEITYLAKKSKLGQPEPQSAYRIDYLVKYLESQYVPIHTKEFYSMAHSGEWMLLYSNSLAPRAHENLSLTVTQEIRPGPSNSNGTVCYNINWDLEQEIENAVGILKVHCSYSLSPNGAMQVALAEHVLLPDIFPSIQGLSIDKSCEQLVEFIQSSVPYEVFDPDQTTVGTSFLSPQFRIARVLGNKYPNVINIFYRY
jgi:hypothetical protein